eukprot:g10636.t1
MALKGDSQAAELERLRIACQVGSAETISKAQEILRLMSSKCRQGSLGRGDLCRTAIAFDLACRALACPVPHKTAVKLSGLPSEALYVAALGTAQRLLGLQQRYTCEEIAKLVGGKRVGVMATAELKRYKERFIASYPARQVASINLDGTVYAVSAFYLCAKKLKHPVDKQRLLDLSLVREAEFTAVCRSMLDLCYGTLGVSVSDKPSADRLAGFEKAAALGKASTAAANDPSSTAVAPAAAAAGSSGTSTQYRKGGVTSGERRSIPLSSGNGRRGLGAPRSHIAHLARSIQIASQRKRYGGMTVALAEPGGNNESNNSLHDKTHRPKRPRRPVPVATPATTPTGCSAAATAATAAAGPPPPQAPKAVPAPVHNPYAARRPATAPPSAPADRAAPTNQPSGGAVGIGRGGACHADSCPRGQSLGEAVGAAGRGTGGPAAGEGESDEGGGGQQPLGRAEYAEWKEKALASMENRMRGKSDPSSSPSSSFGAAGLGPSDPDAAGAAHVAAAEDVSAPSATSSATLGDVSRTIPTPTATPAASPAPSPVVAGKKTKQASLTSFFTPTN